LSIVIIALILGIALVIGGERYRHFRSLFEELQSLSLMVVGWIMRLSPWGIAALLLQLVATHELELLRRLFDFIAVVIGSTLFHGIVVLPLLLYLVTRMSPLRFWRGAREALITAFATSSSAATVPVSLRCAEQHLHVRKEVANFVIPLGATVNMDGTALYEAAAALFVARLAGVELDIVHQLIIFVVAMLGAIGAPGIPSVGMLSMVLVLESVGLPTAAIAILLPIDRLLDTVRTTVNVEGDLIGSLVVQKLSTESAHEDVAT
jgi:Na+/H+-dicarboxylate symporter